MHPGRNSDWVKCGSLRMWEATVVGSPLCPLANDANPASAAKQEEFLRQGPREQ